MFLFYTPDITTNPELPEAESQHCIRVLRMSAGDSIHLVDGKGHFFQATITDPHPKHCRIELTKTIDQPLPWVNRIQIALAPTKNMDRTEWFAEKVTEIGINKISFLNCRFSERKEIKTERIEKILIAAMKQSVKATLPEVQTMSNFDSFITHDFDGQKFIAHCYPGEKPLLSQAYKKGNNALILIGPEGDFSEEEVKKANALGFQSISLGDSRLRTETAALTACQTVHIVNQL